MSVDRRVLLLSVRPRFAQAILDGTKTVEVRRRPIRATPGTLVIFYASAPTMAIVGTARLDRVIFLKPGAAWRDHGRSLGLARREFDDYLDGRMPWLLVLRDVAALDKPLELQDLRRRSPFQPPQSYRYMKRADPLRVRSLAS